MIVALKIVILLVLLLLFAYPLLPLPSKMRRFSTFYALTFSIQLKHKRIAFLRKNGTMFNSHSNNGI